MLNFRNFSRLLCCSILLTLVCASAQAKVNFIVSVAPPVTEVVAPPPSYVDCYTAPAGIYNGIWINAHRICNYSGGPGRDVWIAGYWGCGSYNSFNGVCSHWSWYPSHWMRAGYSEYGVHYRSHGAYYHNIHHYDYYHHDYHHHTYDHHDYHHGDEHHDHHHGDEHHDHHDHHDHH